MQTKKARAIILALETHSRPLTPMEIASITGLNHRTVRSYVRRLLKEGMIKQPYYGYYCNSPTHGVGEPPPRVQNLVLSALVPWLCVKQDTIDEFVGDVGFRIVFGVKRGKVTGFISRDVGMDYAEAAMAVELFRLYVASRVGRLLDGEEIEVRSCEFLRDYDQLRLNGVNCVTVRSFLGGLERIYNRNPGLRSEIKVQPQNVNVIMALLKGGVSSYNIIQGQFLMVQKIEQLTDAVKGSNRFMAVVIGLLKELLERRLRDE